MALEVVVERPDVALIANVAGMHAVAVIGIPGMGEFVNGGVFGDFAGAAIVLKINIVVIPAPWPISHAISERDVFVGFWHEHEIL